MVSPGNEDRLVAPMGEVGRGALPPTDMGGPPEGINKGEWLLGSAPSSASLRLRENMKGEDVDDSGSTVSSSPLLSDRTMMSESKLGGGDCDNTGMDISTGGRN